MSRDHVAIIGKLLAQAESTSVRAEADAFMAAAQNLASKHSIDLALARAADTKSKARETIAQETLTIGEKGRRGLRWYVQLFCGVAEPNDVKVSFAHDRTVVWAHGFPSDIEVVIALYGSLVNQMVRSADDYLRSPTHRKGAVHGSTARTSFYAGFITEITARLANAREEAVAEAQVARDASSHDSTLPVSVALALRDKRKEVDDSFAEYRRREGIRSVSLTRATVASTPLNHGRAAGRRAQLRDRRGIGS